MSEMKKIGQSVTTQRFIRDEDGKHITETTVEHFELDEKSDLLKARTEFQKMSSYNMKAWAYLDQLDKTDPQVAAVAAAVMVILDGKSK